MPDNTNSAGDMQVQLEFFKQRSAELEALRKSIRSGGIQAFCNLRQDQSGKSKLLLVEDVGLPEIHVHPAE